MFRTIKIKASAKNTLQVLLVLSLLFMSRTTHAQQGGGNQKIGILIGSVVDSATNKALDYVSVKLFSVKDSLLKAGVYSNEKGIIKLDEIPLGLYYIKISFATYETEIIPNIAFTMDKPSRDIGQISLHKDEAVTQDLKEMQVTGKQDLLLNNIDKRVYNVGEDLSVRGGTANDILNNVPSVEIDQEGKISLRGDGNVTILIDGRPSSLSGSNGKSLLDALPANSIERIEIVTNPSAKYDPDGTSGIINIVLKKNKLKGINGNVALSAGTGNVYNGSAALSVRNAKTNIYGTYSYRYYEGFRDYESHLVRQIGDSSFTLDQNRAGTDLMINHTAKVGSDFYIRDRNTLGIAFTGNFGNRERTGDLNNLLYDSAEVLNRYWVRGSSDPSQNQNFDINLNYKNDFKADRGSFTIDLTQSVGNEKIYGYYEEDYVTLHGADDPSTSLMQQLANTENNRVSTIQTDLIRILPKSIKVEAGAKTIVRHSGINTNSSTRDNATNTYFSDTLSNFQYQYDEQIYSLYGNFAQQIKKFKYQGGLRLEHALQLPQLAGSTESFRNEYSNIFPSAFLKYELKADQELSLSYSRRINRPTSENLNPFTSYADPYNLRKGNPALKPEYINSFDLGYSLNKKKVTLTVSAFFRQTTSVISRVKNFYDNGATAVTYGNIDNSISMGPEVVFTYKPFPWMRNTLSGNGNSIKYTDDTPGFNWNNSGFFWNMKYAGSFDFWKKTATLQVNARYNSPIITAQGRVQPRASVDLSGDKTFKEGKWTVGFRLTDVFNTQEFRLEVDQPNSYQTSRFKQNTRRFYVNISYKFGKYDIKKIKPVTDGGGGGDF